MEISFTRYRVYRECPWKYKLKFVDEQSVPLTPKASFGASIHFALESWLSDPARAPETIVEALDANWISDGYADREEAARWRSKAARVLRAFALAEISRRSSVIDVEAEFTFALGGHTVRGMIDRIDREPDGGYEVIDYKTGPHSPTTEDVARDVQLQFYALGAARGLSLPVKTLTIDSVSAGERVSVPYDAASAETLMRDITLAADSIEKKTFAADTRFCARCDYAKTCEFSVKK